MKVEKNKSYKNFPFRYIRVEISFENPNRLGIANFLKSRIRFPYTFDYDDVLHFPVDVL